MYCSRLTSCRTWWRSRKQIFKIFTNRKQMSTQSQNKEKLGTFYQLSVPIWMKMRLSKSRKKQFHYNPDQKKIQGYLLNWRMSFLMIRALLNWAEIWGLTKKESCHKSSMTSFSNWSWVRYLRSLEQNMDITLLELIRLTRRM